MPRPKVYVIRNDKFRGISLQRLLMALTEHGQHLEIVVTRESGVASQAMSN
jgi:hypothetical protein